MSKKYKPPKKSKAARLAEIPIKRNSELQTKATFVNNALSIPQDAVESALTAKVGDQPLYFRALLRKTSLQVVLVLVPSFNDKCAVNRLKAWKVNKAGKRFYISSSGILQVMGLSEGDAQNTAMPFGVVADEIRIPFPRKTTFEEVK